METKGKRVYIFLGVFLLLFIGLSIWLAISRLKAKPEATIIQEIKLQKGDVSLTINRSGLLTVSLPEGIFQQEWDQEKVKAFFSRFEAEDLTSFANFIPDEQSYFLVITRSDGSQTIFRIPIFDTGINIPGVIGELIDTFKDVTNVTPTPTVPAVQPTGLMPTTYFSPTPRITMTVPTPTPTRASDGGQGQTHFQCDFYDPTIIPDIISETACTPER